VLTAVAWAKVASAQAGGDRSAPPPAATKKKL